MAKGKKTTGGLSSRLTRRQERFIAEYLIDLNATQAAIRAGYSRRTAENIGWENLRKPQIASVVGQRQAEQLGRADLTAQRVLEEVRRLAFSDIRAVFDKAGNLKPLRELTDEQAASIASVEVVIRNMKDGNPTEEVHKIKTWDKPRALELACKHLGLLKETLNVPGLTDVAAMLAKKCIDEIYPGPTAGKTA